MNQSVSERNPEANSAFFQKRRVFLSLMQIYGKFVSNRIAICISF